MISIVAVDIGLKTLSIYKEYFDQDRAKCLKLPKAKYDKFLAATDEFEEYVIDVAKCGQAMFFEKTCLGERNDLFSGKALFALYDYFDKLNNDKLFDDVDVVIIEKQLKRNPMATTIMDHLHAWFLINFRSFKKIILYPSKNKTRILGAPLKVENDKGKAQRVDKSFRKKWAKLKCYEILKERDDQEWLDYVFVKNKSKSDDLSDTCVMCLAYHIQKLIK